MIIKAFKSTALNYYCTIRFCKCKTAKSDAILAESDLSRELLFVGKNQKIVDLSCISKNIAVLVVLATFLDYRINGYFLNLSKIGAS